MTPLDNTRHTPGPWRAKTERVIVAETYYINAHGEKSFYDKEIAWTQPISSTAQGSRVANARLIAAAPDLLTAVNEAFDFLGGVDGASEIRDTLLAAILKATGGGK